VRHFRTFTAVNLVMAGLLATALARAADEARSEASPPGVGNPYLSPERGSTTGVPFELYGHLIVVKGSVGELEDLNLAVDTGASSTVVGERLARTLGLKGERTVEVGTWGTRRRLRRVTLPSLRIGPLEFSSVSALAAPLPSAEGVAIDALIGLDLLRGFNFTIDFASSRITVGDPPDLPHTVRLHQHPLFLAVRLYVRERPMWVLLDSGADGLSLFRGELPDGVRMRTTRRHRDIPHAGGRGRAEEAHLNGVSLDGVDLGAVPVYLMQARDGVPIENLRGVLGIAWLGFERVAFDFERSRFGFERSDRR
jgi:predicted aspartyl protease